MSETATLPPLPDEARGQVPTVYFIDDSATMREVIKIAFRRENIHVVTCPDAATALEQFEEIPPDAVITDVIMPDKDGYEVCSHIKQHPKFADTPVILMSGIVNKSVADKAIAVKADELIRKPFQPQELITRVKGLLQPKTAASEPPATAPRPFGQPAGVNPLSDVFAQRPAPPPQPAVPPPAVPSLAETAWPRALAEAFSPRPSAPVNPPAAPAQRTAAGVAAEVQRLKNEIMRIELLVKKLQTELLLERQYCQALEQQIKTLQESLNS
jgi:CheY-like chemotaxis protein